MGGGNCKILERAPAREGDDSWALGHVCVLG
jgi:hypothetical protein